MLTSLLNRNCIVTFREIPVSMNLLHRSMFRFVLDWASSSASLLVFLFILILSKHKNEVKVLSVKVRVFNKRKSMRTSMNGEDVDCGYLRFYSSSECVLIMSYGKK